MHRAGIKLGPGTYHVTAKAEDGYHINLACSQTRHAPFEVNFSMVFLYFKVRQTQAACHPGPAEAEELIAEVLHITRHAHAMCLYPTNPVCETKQDSAELVVWASSQRGSALYS